MTTFLRNAALCIAVFAGALLLSIGAQRWWNSRGATDWRSTELVAGTGGATAVAPVQMPGATRIALIIGGVSHVVDGQQIALPNGARFQLQIRSDQPTAAEVFAVSPTGQSSALWQGTIRGGASITSPMLKLQGTRGLETLRVSLRDASGRVSEQRVEIWHL